jgi:CRP/FNR family transcriptional regulator/CRP/FNR family cyclic AMP-dependent transcriptional regulator
VLHSSAYFRGGDPVAVLASASLFNGTPLEELTKLAPALRSRHYARGGILFNEGDPANALFVIRSGQVKIGRVGRGGEEVVFRLLGPTDSFGEAALLEPELSRAAFAQAMEDTECVALSKDAFLQFVDAYPPTLHHIIKLLMTYLRATDAAFADMAFLDIPGRVARKLLELAEAKGEPVPGGIRINTRLSQRTLAAMVCASRENVNRALSSFQDRGAIIKEKGVITVIRAEILRSRS